MSRPLIRAALESALAAMTPALATANENVPFTPTTGTPYQAVFILMPEPVNIEIGTAYRQDGYMQVNLNYPLNAGPAAAEARAELIRTTFPRGRTFTVSGVTVHITNTVHIGNGRTESGWYFLPVRIPFHSHIRS